MAAKRTMTDDDAAARDTAVPPAPKTISRRAFLGAAAAVGGATLSGAPGTAAAGPSAAGSRSRLRACSLRRRKFSRSISAWRSRRAVSLSAGFFDRDLDIGNL